MKICLTAAAAASLLLAATATASPTVDGTIGAGEYAGALTTQIVYDLSATGDFNLVGYASNTEAYTVYYTADATNVYVALQTNPAGAGQDNHDTGAGLTFANLYFNTDAVGGSDLGFEVTNNDAFIPATGVKAFNITSLGAAYAATAGTTYANGGAASVIEFSVPWTFFTTGTLGLGQPLTPAGGPLQLRSSQSFGYIVDGGDRATYLTTRFGSLLAPLAGAVPEPSTWAMMIGGFGLVGGAMRRRRATLAIA